MDFYLTFYGAVEQLKCLKEYMMPLALVDGSGHKNMKLSGIGRRGVGPEFGCVYTVKQRAESFRVLHSFGCVVSCPFAYYVYLVVGLQKGVKIVDSEDFVGPFGFVNPCNQATSGKVKPPALLYGVECIDQYRPEGVEKASIRLSRRLKANPLNHV